MAGRGEVALGAVAPPGAPRFLEAGRVRLNRGARCRGRALHQPPRVGLSAGVEAAAPPPVPAVEKYPGAQVPTPLPRPRAGSGPSRPSGKAPSRPAPAPPPAPAGRGCGVRGAGWEWAPRAARPLPSPAAAWARPTRTGNEGWAGEGAGYNPQRTTRP